MKATVALGYMMITACVGTVNAEPTDDVFWVETENGDWDDPARWSSQTFYPQNGPLPEDHYRAIIDVSGQPYRVLMDERFATYVIDALVLDSPDLTFEHANGQVRVDTVDLVSGAYLFNGSGTRAVLVDTEMTIGPAARVIFSGDDGFPRQATGAFRRCSIVGDLHLDVQNAGVLFEESVELAGDIYLEAPGAAAIFNGPGFILGATTIHAGDYTTIELATGGESFVLAADASIVGSVVIKARGGGTPQFYNEGQIILPAGGLFDDLIVVNRGLISMPSGRAKIDGNASQFTNIGEVNLGGGAEFWLNFSATGRNDGLIVLAPGAKFRTIDPFILGPDSRIESSIDQGVGPGYLLFEDTWPRSVLDGALTVSVDDPSSYALGDEFRLVECTSFSGRFTTLDMPAPPAEGLDWHLRYDSAGVTLVVTCDADFNMDGTIDTLDMLAFLSAWGSDDPRADWNGDGNIDTLDFLGFLNGWVAGC